MGIFDNLRNQVNNTTNKLNKQVSTNQTLNNNYANMYGKLIDVQGDNIRNSSKRFIALKNSYDYQNKLSDKQKDISADQNKQIIDFENKIKENKKKYNLDKDRVATYSRKLLYDKKDLKSYNLFSNILKFILLLISIAVIYLLVKK